MVCGGAVATVLRYTVRTRSCPSPAHSAFLHPGHGPSQPSNDSGSRHAEAVPVTLTCDDDTACADPYDRPISKPIRPGGRMSYAYLLPSTSFHLIPQCLRPMRPQPWSAEAQQLTVHYLRPTRAHAASPAWMALQLRGASFEPPNAEASTTANLAANAELTSKVHASESACGHDIVLCQHLLSSPLGQAKGARNHAYLTQAEREAAHIKAGDEDCLAHHAEHREEEWRLHVFLDAVKNGGILRR